MHEGTVEKSTLRQIEVGDSVSVLEAFHIRPVLLSCRRPQIGRCGSNRLLTTTYDCLESHVTLERIRKDLMEIGLITTNVNAVGQSNTDRRQICAASWFLSQGGPEIEQPRPLSRVLSACNFLVGAVDERVSAISQ